MPARLARFLRPVVRVRPDRELLRAHLDGDSAAFDELVRRHAGLAQRVAAEVCPAAADDVAQNTLALLARKAASVVDRESAAGWVFETARRLALKARTAAARRAAREARAEPPQPPTDPLDTLTLREVRAAVAEELARLPDELRLPLVLCYWDGASRSSAADRLGCSTSTLKRRLDAGRERLAAGLARRGFAAPAVFAALLAVEAAAGADVPLVPCTPSVSGSWKVLSAVVVAAGVAVGVGIGISAPVAADAPAPAEQPAPPPPAADRPGSAVDRYGDPLPEGAVARFGTVRFRHGDQLQAVTYSRDGKTIASAAFGRIMLWEAETGKPIASLVRTVSRPTNTENLLRTEKEVGHNFSLAFAPNGKWLVSAGSESVAHDKGHVMFWNVEARKWHKAHVHMEGQGTHWGRAVAVSRDGKTIAAGTDSGVLWILDGETQDVVRTVKVRAVSGLSFAPNGKTLAVATYQDVILIDPTTGTETRRLETGRARQVVFTPDGESVWVGCDGGQRWKKDDDQPGTISRWNLRTGKAAQTFQTVPDLFLSLAISPDGKTLASGGVNAGPFLWNAETGKSVDLNPTARLRPWVHGLAFSPDGKTLSSADTHGRVRVWDVAEKRELHRYDEHAGGVLKAAVSPDGKHAATAGGDGTVRVWDMATGRALRSWVADDTRSVFTVAYTPDGGSLLTSGWDGTVRLWDADTGQEVRRFPKSEHGARSALSPDGKLVAVSGKDGTTIALYETATGRPVRELTGHVSHLMRLTFTPDGKRLVSAADMHSDNGQHHDDRSVRVWDVATGRQFLKLDAGRPHGGAAVSPDSRVIAAAGYIEDEKTGYLRFWDAATGKEITERRVKGGGAVAFSPDGRYLATADRDVQLVEVATGRVVQSFESGAGSVYGLTFTPDGRRLVSAHDDGTALVWDLTPRPAMGLDAGKLWDLLAADDAAAARRAAWALAADPATVGMLGEKLKPVPNPAGRRTAAALVADLDAPAFAVREAASKELVGRVAVDGAELAAAMTDSPSAEVRRRLTEVIRSAPTPWPRLSAEELRAVRAVGVLEAIGTPEARRLLRALADGDPYALLTREARAASVRLGG